MDKLTFAEFNEQADIALIISNYLRGAKLEFLTSRDKEIKTNEILKRFKEKGLL